MSATDQPHLQGQTIDKVDQLSSVVLLGLAVAGGLGVVVLDLLLIG